MGQNSRDGTVLYGIGMLIACMYSQGRTVADILVTMLPFSLLQHSVPSVKYGSTTNPRSRRDNACKRGQPLRMEQYLSVGLGDSLQLILLLDCVRVR